MTRRVVVVVVLGVLALTAAPASAATSADQQLAQVGVLQLSDFPSGWNESARGPESDDAVDEEAARITTCKAFTAFAAANRKNPRARSRSFDLGRSKVVNTVSVYPTTAKAEAAVATFGNSKLPLCLEHLFRAVFERQLHSKESTAKQVRSVTTDIAREAGIRLGDDAIVYRGKVDVGLKNGTTQTIGLGLITVRVGTVVAGYSYTNSTDISAALQPAIVASVTRLQRAAPST